MKQLFKYILFGALCFALLFAGFKCSEASDAYEKQYKQTLLNNCRNPVFADSYFRPATGPVYIYRCENGSIVETRYNPTEMGAK